MPVLWLWFVLLRGVREKFPRPAGMFMDYSTCPLVLLGAQGVALGEELCLPQGAFPAGIPAVLSTEHDAAGKEFLLCC